MDTKNKLLYRKIGARVKHKAPRPPVQRGYGHSVIFKYLAVLPSQIALVKSLAVTLDI